MRLALTLLLSIVLVSPVFAQNKECEDLSCLVYILATDPLQPKVAEYIKKYNGWTFKEKGPAIDDPAFVYFTSQIEKNRYEKGSDLRELVSGVRVDGTEAIDEVLRTLGYPKDYESLRAKNPKKYVKVKKKYNGIKVPIGYDRAVTAPRGDFTDCWRGSIQYNRNAEGVLMVSTIQLSLIKYSKDEAINYNPVGWHTTNMLVGCETGDCTVCNIGKLGDLKGVTIEENDGFRKDKITIDVQNTDIELPLGLSKDVTYEELMFWYGASYPWEMEEGVFSFETVKNPIKFYFEDEVLIKIVAEGIECNSVFKPIQLPIVKTVVLGGETPDSPALIEYSGGFSYAGEMKDGLPNGFGTLTGTEKSAYGDPKKLIYGNLFEKGRFNGYGKLDKPICISGDCSARGMVLTEHGIYQGELKDGQPHGFGVLLYTYDRFRQRYQGQFENGYGISAKGKIDYHPDGYYQGAIARSLPNGNGTEYNENGNILFSRWYEDGTRKGPQRVLEDKNIVSEYRYNSLKGSKEEYIASSIAAFRQVQQNKLYAGYGSNFETGALYCGRTISSVSILRDCIRSSHSKYTGDRYKTSSQIEEMWTEITKAIGAPTCYKDGSSESPNATLVETKRLFDKYQYYVDNLSAYYSAAIAPLNSTQAQRDSDLAQTLFSGAVSGIRSSFSIVDSYFSDFADSVIELEKVLKENGCLD